MSARLSRKSLAFDRHLPGRLQRVVVLSLMNEDKILGKFSPYTVRGLVSINQHI